MLNTQSTTSRFQHFFSLIRQSLNGETQDYTTGSIRRAVLLLAVPMVLEMCMESVFALVDIYFVSHLGKHATSVVGLTESVITIVYSLAIGISMAATAMVARRVGEKNTAAASRAGMQSMLIALFFTVIISVTGFVFSGELLHLMGAEPETIASGQNYTRILMAGSLVIMLLFLLNGIFRGAGDAMMAMKSLWIANICNIILCPILIRGLGPIPAFGITGAAMATTIGRGIGVLYQLYHLFNGRHIVKFVFKHLAPDWKVIRSIFNIAWPATLQFLIGSGSWIVLTSLVARTGHSDASAGYQIAIRIVMFFLLPAWGLSNAAATLVGQNLGALQPQRAEESVIKTAKYNAIFMFVVSLLIIGFAPWIISFFTKEESVANYAIAAARIICAGYVFYGIGMVMVNAFNGAGDTKTPTVINLVGFWCFQIPLAYGLATIAGMGPTGVFIAIPVAETAISIAAFILFKKGYWKLKKV
ncbi:MAG: MATE family efflux transporter [Chitinophagaceae bacterium]|nr:MATE family efflux transporter [Chitinophagaceae bacterium]